MREWGRIGSAGTLLVQSFPTQAEAEAAAAHVRRLKKRKGYHDIAEQETSCILLYAGHSGLRPQRLGETSGGAALWRVRGGAGPGRRLRHSQDARH